MKKLTFGTLAN